MSPFNDLLAEMEYTMVPSTGLRGARAVNPAWWAPPNPGPRRRFWCAEAQREVEVEFLGRRAVPFSAPSTTAVVHATRHRRHDGRLRD